MTRTHATAAVATGSAADFIPPDPTLAKLKAAAGKCRGCPLWVNASQTVFGEGSQHAEVMLVGEPKSVPASHGSWRRSGS